MLSISGGIGGSAEWWPRFRIRSYPGTFDRFLGRIRAYSDTFLESGRIRIPCLDSAISWYIDRIRPYPGSLARSGRIWVLWPDSGTLAGFGYFGRIRVLWPDPVVSGYTLAEFLLRDLCDKKIPGPEPKYLAKY